MSTLKAVPDQPSRLTDRVADEVRANMARARMTQTGLADVLGLTQSAVSKRLRGKIAFSVDELEKISDALGVHPAVLLGGTPNNSPSPSGGSTLRSLSVSDTQSEDKAAIFAVNSQVLGVVPDAMRSARPAAA